MNIIELKPKLDELGVDSNEYSFDGSIAKWDTIVLDRDYSKWEVFYIDERGDRDFMEIIYKKLLQLIQLYSE